MIDWKMMMMMMMMMMMLMMLIMMMPPILIIMTIKNVEVSLPNNFTLLHPATGVYHDDDDYCDHHNDDDYMVLKHLPFISYYVCWGCWG